MSEQIKIIDFFNNSYCDFGSYDNYRKLASIVDGLKPSGRKCVHVVLKDKINTMFKVQNLCARVSQKTNYIHGASSLYGVIVGLAQDFVGTNNIPLFQRKGNFGNRLIPEASADRYIFTCSQDYLQKIFIPQDNHVLNQQVFQGDIIEPMFYAPIIPLLLVNGSIGLTTGFNQKIIPRNPDELIQWIKCKLDNKKFKGKLIPYYNNFKGTINHISDGVYEIVGKYQKISHNKIQISDIPCGPGTGGYSDLKSYLNVLDKLVQDKLIKQYNDYSQSNSYKIIVTFFKNQGLDINNCDIIKQLKLSKTVTQSYTSVNSNNNVVQYNSVFDILQDYYKVRYQLYQKRKQNLIKKITDKVVLTASRYLFVKGVIDQTIILNNKSKQQIIKQLTKIPNIVKDNNDSYDYLLNMPISSITKQRYSKLKQQIKQLKGQLDTIKKQTIQDMWKEDLATLKKGLKKFN